MVETALSMAANNLRRASSSFFAQLHIQIKHLVVCKRLANVDVSQAANRITHTYRARTKTTISLDPPPSPTRRRIHPLR